MKKLRAGLVVEGKSTTSSILRLSSVAEELGPVKSGSLQVARRVSNFLRAGYAVTSYQDLAAARIILIKVPDVSVPRIVQELCASELDLKEISFILCETWMRTEALLPLRERGACIASIVAITEGKHVCFAVEGDLAAVRQIRRLVDGGEVKTVELRTGAKHLLFAAMVLLTAVPLPILMAAQQALRDGGVSGNQLSGMVEDLASGTLAGFLRAPKLASAGVLNDCPKEDADAYFGSLSLTHPDLADRLNGLLEITGQRSAKLVG
jgi:hypothetical protein